MIQRALISVYDKTGLEVLLPVLEDLGVTIISSGGTAQRIREIGYNRIIDVEAYTDHPESPGGLVKTLHPKIHGGILLNPDIPEHQEYLAENDIDPIDLIVVNLYPFEETVTSGAGLKEAAENIDIGGPTMIRSAAKAALLYNHVAVVVDPGDYMELADALVENEGCVPSETIMRLAENAFKHTAHYENVINDYLEAQ
ncbi:MAG: IMP cyclohydrolase [Candidatus Bathyarchaeia archaeon]